MTKRRTSFCEICNPERYFNRYIAMEIRKDKLRQREYDNFFCSLESKLSKHFSSTQRSLAFNSDGIDLEKQIIARDLLSWIDYIESPALFHTLSQFTKQQQLLLTYRFHLCLSQRETARLLSCTQSTVQRCEKRLIQKLKISLEV